VVASRYRTGDRGQPVGREDATVARTRQDSANAVHASRAKTLKSGDLQLVRDDLSGLLAHDLKTPLAAIAMNLDFALAELEPTLPEGLRSALEDCRQANVRAIRIVSDMADAVRLTVGDRRPVLTDVSIGSVVAGVVERASEEARGRGVRLVCATDETVVRADVELLSRALDRLLERALRHARASTQIGINQSIGGVAIRVETITDGRGELATRTLATYFAEAAMRTQGGAVWTETDGVGELVYRLSLPR
jgi:K+-sensing histidine kinase KdpD